MAGCTRLASASVQDRDGTKSVLLDTYLRTPVRFVFADGGFAGRLLEWATQILWGSRTRSWSLTSGFRLLVRTR